MSQRQLHEQIRRAFSVLTRPPRPQLSERIRDTLWSRQVSAAAPARLPVPPAAVIATVVLLAMTAAAVVEGPAAARLAGSVSAGLYGMLTPPRTAARPTPTPTRASASPSAALSPSPSPSIAPTETPSPATPPPPTPLPASLPGYGCSAQSAGGGAATMTAARAGAQKGYDRFVVQFSGGVPQYEVTPQDSASFNVNGGSVTLQGSAGLMVVLHNTSGGGAFGGPGDLRPSGFAQIKEAKVLSDSGGTVEWGIGIGKYACFHAWTLPGPPRLVIDIATG